MVAAFESECLLREPAFGAELPQRDPEKLFRSCGRSTPPAMPLHAQTNTATICTIVTRDYSTDRFLASIIRQVRTHGPTSFAVSLLAQHGGADMVRPNG